MKIPLLPRLTLAGLLGAATALPPAARAADTVQLHSASYEVNEVWTGQGVSPVGLLGIGLNYAGAGDSGATVRMVVAGGTAVEGADFMLSSSEWWTDGSAHPMKTIQLPNGIVLIALDDGLPEGDETVVLRLVDPSPGLELGALGECTVTIRNGKPAFALSYRSGDMLFLPEGPDSELSIRRVGDRSTASVAELELNPNADGFNPAGSLGGAAGRTRLAWQSICK